ncbi:MAG: hypothetical protein HC906_05185 [Bacteroidales bacterium]|nr:hypothetical protein [Bacteroidales bacterium]
MTVWLQPNRQKQQQIQDGYQSAINSGNSLFAQKQFQQAKDAYQNALTYKPDDVFAKNKIAESDKLIALEIEKQKALDAKSTQYKELIIKADDFFSVKNYVSAKSEYQKALAVMPDQAHPKQRIQEIDQIALAEAQKQREIDAGYQKAFVEGNTYFNQKAYEKCKKIVPTRHLV